MASRLVSAIVQPEGMGGGRHPVLGCTSSAVFWVPRYEKRLEALECAQGRAKEL